LTTTYSTKVADAADDTAAARAMEATNFMISLLRKRGQDTQGAGEARRGQDDSAGRGTTMCTHTVERWTPQDSPF
jgi:hypothetical protein